MTRRVRPYVGAAIVVASLCGGVVPAHGAITVATSVAQFVTEPASVSRMYAALDPGGQVYLVVWSTFSEVAKGQFLNAAGRPITSPFTIASAAGYARVVRGANEFLVTYQRHKPERRYGRSVKFVNGAVQLGNEFFITDVFVDSDAGMVYVPSAQHYLVSSWRNSSGYRSYVTGVRADGTITIPTTLVTGSATDTASPELACDFASSKCLMVGYGDLKRTWGQYFNPVTGATLGSLFTIDSGSLQEDHNIEWNATNRRFLVLFVRNRNSIAAKRILANGSIDPTATTVIAGNYGQLSLSYNSGANSFVAAFKDGAGDNKEYCWIQEFNGEGAMVAGQLKRISPLPTNGNAAPITVANASRKEYLFVQTRNYSAGDAGVLAATTPATGSTPPPPAPPPPPPPPPGPSFTTLQTAAEADFNGDLKPDLLWQRTDGAIATWTMNGLTAVDTEGINPSPVDPSWKIVGAGDLDGNGKPEIIWQHTSGELAAWGLSGDTMYVWALLNPSNVDPTWRVMGIADLNRDSKADLIWQSDSGLLVVWYMNGVTMSSWAYLNPNNPGDPRWRVVGAGDLNADGKPDLIWRHARTGALAAWFMNVATRSSWSWLSPNTAAGTGWTIGAVLDLNGDGRTDLVWQHTSGAVAAWLMNGATAVSMPSLSPDTVAAGWELVGPR